MISNKIWGKNEETFSNARGNNWISWDSCEKYNKSWKKPLKKLQFYNLIKNRWKKTCMQNGI